jgi:hypothetical protein
MLFAQTFPMVTLRASHLKLELKAKKHMQFSPSDKPGAWRACSPKQCAVLRALEE